MIDLSRSLEPRIVALHSIAEVDSVYWFDEREQPTVRKVVDHARLILDVDLPYPIILGVDGRVMDGMHRIARAILDGHETIVALQFDVHPEAGLQRLPTGRTAVLTPCG